MTLYVEYYAYAMCSMHVRLVYELCVLIVATLTCPCSPLMLVGNLLLLTVTQLTHISLQDAATSYITR